MDKDYIIASGLIAFLFPSIVIVCYILFKWKFITKIGIILGPSIGIISFLSFCLGKIGINVWSITLIPFFSVTSIIISLIIIIKMVTNPVNRVVSLVQDIAQGEGDLTKRLEVTTTDEMGELSIWVNVLMENLQGIITQVVNSTQQIATASREIATTSEQMARGSESQKNQITEVVTAMEEMASTIIEVAKNASNTSDTAYQAMESAKKGGEVVNQTIEGIEKVANAVEDSTSRISGLGNRAEEIGEIIEVVDDIADQTNLLALNAAIEAARAGEQGRGFAVVADEVRKLAERTTSATKEVSSTIKTIQEETNSAVSSMKVGTDNVHRGVSLVNQSGDALNEIIEESKRITELVVQIANAAGQQSQTAEEISKSFESISAVTHQSAISTQEEARAIHELNKQIEGLESLVMRFKL